MFVTTGIHYIRVIFHTFYFAEKIAFVIPGNSKVPKVAANVTFGISGPKWPKRSGMAVTSGHLKYVSNKKKMIISTTLSY